MKLLSKKVQARIKLITLFLFSIFFIYIITNRMRSNLIFQISLYIVSILYYLFTNKDLLKTLLSFTRFLMMVIIVIHIIFFLFKSLTMGFNYSLNFYLERWESIVIRIFIIPNIFGYINLVISKFSFIDLILLSNNSNKGRVFYILMVSGLEVMERIKIHYEFHPDNFAMRKRDKIVHYLAVPLTLFFGIYRGFENKYNTLTQRDKVLRSK